MVAIEVAGRDGQRAVDGVGAGMGADGVAGAGRRSTLATMGPALLRRGRRQRIGWAPCRLGRVYATSKQYGRTW